jgi:Fic family protein
MQEIIQTYLEKYLPRREIIHRLPVTMPISKIWPELTQARRAKSKDLPLFDSTGKPFWFVLTDDIISQANEIVKLAQQEIVFSSPEFEKLHYEAVIDEAVYSSIIEGAFTTKQDAKEFIENIREPKNKSEQMVKNNYDALTYVLENIDSPITQKTIFEIFRLVTKNTLEYAVPFDRYRNENVMVRKQNGEIVHTAPDYKQVPEMMDLLIHFIGNDDMAPVLKACIVHFYFVYVHPFVDGNGRTARALSYMLLLQSGYDFFRYFSISSIIADERTKYYNAIKDVEDDAGDMTYFINYYTGMLSRAIHLISERVLRKASIESIIQKIEESDLNNKRLPEGAEWILTSAKKSVSVEAWKKKFNVSTETARQDLLKLAELDVVEKRMDGKKLLFDVK